MKKKAEVESKKANTFAQGPIMTAFLLIILLGTAVFGVRSYQENSRASKVVDFKTCKEAGYPIMESHPAQCAGPNKKTYTEVVSPAPTALQTEPIGGITDDISGTPAPYHGRSTGGACNSDSDCVMNGCNKEICQSKDEESLMSTCEYREDTPLRLGYSCGCVSNTCAWTK